MVDGKLTKADPPEEDLKEGYFVLDGLEKGVEAQLICVLDPFVPLCITGGGASSRDSTVDVFRCSAEVAAERICDDGVASCQGRLCG